MVVPAWIVDITDSYGDDNHCKQLMQELALSTEGHTKFSFQSGVYRYKGRIYIGQSSTLRDKIFDSFHSSVFGGHSRSRVTIQKIKQLFYWPKMKEYITTKVPECPVCQISKTEKIQYPGLLDPLPIPAAKWSQISMDFIEGLPKSKGKDVILVIVDRLTKYAHFLALSHPYTVSKVADLFMDNIVKLHGPPTAIISDRDRIFTSKLWKELFSAMQISLHYSTAYHPESDGQTERVNQCLEQYLRCMAFSEPKKWVDWLPAAEWWYNCSYHTAIKMSPFEALYEYPPPLLTSLLSPETLSQEAQLTIADKQHMVTKWEDMTPKEATWEDVDLMRLTFPEFKP